MQGIEDITSVRFEGWRIGHWGINTVDHWSPFSNCLNEELVTYLSFGTAAKDGGDSVVVHIFDSFDDVHGSCDLVRGER